MLKSRHLHLFQIAMLLVIAGVLIPTQIAQASWGVNCTDPADLAVLMVDQTQCEALQAFYTNFDGNNWTYHTNWGTVTDVDIWYGVTRSGSTVSVIHLENNNLSGDIANLDASVATELYLGTNNISGDVADLDLVGTNLQTLRIWENNLTGNIGDLNLVGSSITGLLINANNLTGNIEDFVLTPDIGMIYMGDNNLSGNIDGMNLADATSLSFWEMSNAGIGGDVIAVSQLPAIDTLWLYDNQIGGDIGQLDLTGSTLRWFRVDGNAITGDLSQATDLSGLEALDISDNQLNGTVYSFGTQLITHYLCGGANVVNPTGDAFTDFQVEGHDQTGWTWSTGCGDTAIVSSAACNGDNLEVFLTTGDGPFSVSGTGSDLPQFGNIGMVSMAGPGAWTGVTVTETTGDGEIAALGDFTCGDWFVDCTDPVDLAALGIDQAQCEGLRDFYISFDGPNWTNNTNWGTVSDVETWWGVDVTDGAVSLINLIENNLSGDLSSIDLTGMTGLLSLGIEGNNITGDIENFPFDAPALEGLFAANNTIEGDIGAVSLGGTSMKAIDLNGNEIGGSIDEFDLSGTSLELLLLSDNNIGGSIDGFDVGGMATLAYLHLSNNNIGGDIAGFEVPPVLYDLRLNDNAITGDPAHIFEVYSPAFYLYLDNNQLNGTVPAFNPDFLPIFAIDGLRLCGGGNVLNPVGDSLVEGYSLDDFVASNDSTGWTTTTGCGDTTLDVSAVCNGDNLDISLTTGDGPFSITGAGTGLPNTANIGMVSLAGPGAWTGVTVTETTGDGEIAALGDFTCGTQLPNTPILTAPTGTIIDATPDFVWDEGTGATDYQLTVLDGGTSSTVHSQAYSAGSICTGGVCTVSAPGTLPDRAGWWDRHAGPYPVVRCGIDLHGWDLHGDRTGHAE